MKKTPVNDLNRCSVLGCRMHSEVIISKTMGEEKVMFAYCNFHSIISATLFPSINRKEIHV